MKQGDIFLNRNKKSRPQDEFFLKKGSKGKEVWVYIIFGIWALINLFPVYWMFTFSLKSNTEIFGENVAGLLPLAGAVVGGGIILVPILDQPPPPVSP